jgi:alkylation response protein AidB-like acyl-CoA dehydrogenase
MPPADLTDLQRQIATAAEDLAEAEFAGQAFDWQGETPWENVRTLADKGFYRHTGRVPRGRTEIFDFCDDETLQASRTT